MLRRGGGGFFLGYVYNYVPFGSDSCLQVGREGYYGYYDCDLFQWHYTAVYSLGSLSRFQFRQI